MARELSLSEMDASRFAPRGSPSLSAPVGLNLGLGIGGGVRTHASSSLSSSGVVRNLFSDGSSSNGLNLGTAPKYNGANVTPTASAASNGRSTTLQHHAHMQTPAQTAQTNSHSHSHLQTPPHSLHPSHSHVSPPRTLVSPSSPPRPPTKPMRPAPTTTGGSSGLRDLPSTTGSGSHLALTTSSLASDTAMFSLIERYKSSWVEAEAQVLRITNELKEKQTERLQMPPSVWRSVDVLERAGKTDAMDPALHEELTHEVAQVYTSVLGKRRRDSRALGYGFELIARALARSTHEAKEMTDGKDQKVQEMTDAKDKKVPDVPGLAELVAHLLAKTPEADMEKNSVVTHLQLRVERKSVVTGMAGPPPDSVWLIENLSARVYPQLLFSLGMTADGENGVDTDSVIGPEGVPKRRKLDTSSSAASTVGATMMLEAKRVERVALNTYQVTVPAGEPLLLVYGLDSHGDPATALPPPVVVLRLDVLEASRSLATSADTPCYDSVVKALASSGAAPTPAQVLSYLRLLPLHVQSKIHVQGGLSGSSLNTGPDPSKLRLVTGWLQWGADKTG